MTTQENTAPEPEPRVERLPQLQRALERRYPGVTVHTCEYRAFPAHHDARGGGDGITLCFRVQRGSDLLVRCGLAPDTTARSGPDEFGTLRYGGECDGYTYVYHHA
jgi:hypothetical protein